MQNEVCPLCNNQMHSHFIDGRCPKLGTHVVIDAGTLERVKRTGHPRLLKNLLEKSIKDVFTGVEITAIREVDV